jgi:hypothetical protein
MVLLELIAEFSNFKCNWKWNELITEMRKEFGSQEAGN